MLPARPGPRVALPDQKGLGELLVQLRTTVDEEFPSIADEGIIGWQLHSGKTEVSFRDIRIKELPD